MRLFDNTVLTISVSAWFIASLLKVLFVTIGTKRIDFTRFVGTGGMPSTHSAFVSSMTTAVGILEGFGSAIFAVSLVLSLIVMYDASGIRRAAGEQAKILNRLIEHFDDHEFITKRLKELLGHTPLEVFCGASLGVAVALIYLGVII